MVEWKVQVREAGGLPTIRFEDVSAAVEELREVIDELDGTLTAWMKGADKRLWEIEEELKKWQDDRERSLAERDGRKKGGQG